VRAVAVGRVGFGGGGRGIIITIIGRIQRESSIAASAWRRGRRRARCIKRVVSVGGKRGGRARELPPRHWAAVGRARASGGIHGD